MTLTNKAGHTLTLPRDAYDRYLGLLAREDSICAQMNVLEVDGKAHTHAYGRLMRQWDDVSELINAMIRIYR